jgi:hypothetical protein
MRLIPTILLVSTFAVPFAAFAQGTASLQVVPTPATSTPSAILKPALDSIQQALTTVRPEKWKISNDASQQTQANLSSIQTDIQTTLPPLLATADQRPDSVVQVLPAYRNIEALYDVLLRVSQVATLSAPPSRSLPSAKPWTVLKRVGAPWEITSRSQRSRKASSSATCRHSFTRCNPPRRQLPARRLSRPRSKSAGLP